MTELERTIIRCYRRTVAERYSLEYLRGRSPLYGTIADADIDAMREFFLSYLYPDPENREDLEGALQSLGEVLTSPRKLWHLLGANPFRKLGGMLPTALRAGLHTFEAFLKIRKLERRLDEIARARGLRPDELEDPELFLELIRELPAREIEKFRREGTALLESLADGRLLGVTLEIMDDSIRIMKEHPDLFSESELTGIAIGYRLLSGANELFQKLRPEEVPKIITGIDGIEKEWYENVLAGAS